MNPVALKGELHSDSPAPFRDWRVELADARSPGDKFRADIQPDGTFQVRDIAPGDYILRVFTVHGDLLHQELVTARPLAGPLAVRIAVPPRQAAGAGTVSITQLQHPPARKAYQAVAAAQRFSDAGQTGKAVQELEKAIRISPEYAEAYNNLAVQHLRLERYEEAAAELAHSMAIAGPRPMQLSNLAYAQGRLHHFPEAIASARAAVHMDPGSPPAHCILGMLLANDPQTRAEAIQHLERAAESIPSARGTLEKLRTLP